MKHILCWVLIFGSLLSSGQDGSPDLSFGPIGGTYGAGWGLEGDIGVIQPTGTGQYCIGGLLDSYNLFSMQSLVRMNEDGTLDPTFSEFTGFNGIVGDLEIQPDGKLIVVGSFTMYHGFERNRIIRLFPDGTFDFSFNAGSGFNGYVSSVEIDGT